MKDIPKYYDNLDLTLEEILGLIQRGVKDRKSGFHNFVLATSCDFFCPLTKISLM